jgi:hypothetical protein
MFDSKKKKSLLLKSVKIRLFHRFTFHPAPPRIHLPSRLHPLASPPAFTPSRRPPHPTTAHFSPAPSAVPSSRHPHAAQSRPPPPSASPPPQNVVRWRPRTRRRRSRRCRFTHARDPLSTESAITLAGPFSFSRRITAAGPPQHRPSSCRPKGKQ